MDAIFLLQVISISQLVQITECSLQSFRIIFDANTQAFNGFIDLLVGLHRIVLQLLKLLLELFVTFEFLFIHLF